MNPTPPCIINKFKNSFQRYDKEIVENPSVENPPINANTEEHVNGAAMADDQEVPMVEDHTCDQSMR